VKRYRIVERHPYAAPNLEAVEELAAINATDAVRRYARRHRVKGHLRVLVSPVDKGPAQIVEMHFSPLRRWGW
jgi:hypothetical protein